MLRVRSCRQSVCRCAIEHRGGRHDRTRSITKNQRPCCIGTEGKPVKDIVLITPPNRLFALRNKIIRSRGCMDMVRKCQHASPRADEETGLEVLSGTDMGTWFEVRDSTWRSANLKKVSITGLVIL